MATKIKVVRNYTFKAYQVSDEKINATKHEGEFIYKSDCHYYCEKEILDSIQANKKAAIYAIYQISTIEDNNIEDKLIEVIKFDGEKIYINQ